MQLNVQYRVGETGPWTNVPNGYFADVTEQNATPTTHISLLLPTDAMDQDKLQIRIVTTDAQGRDEWIGIDNIVVACFLRGTQILTRRGELPVETLSIGDEIATMMGSRADQVDRTAEFSETSCRQEFESRTGCDQGRCARRQCAGA